MSLYDVKCERLESGPESFSETFEFRRSDSIRDIAGISSHNDDPWGVGFDDFIICETVDYDLDGFASDVDCADLPRSQ